jgi:streptogramin lyase
MAACARSAQGSEAGADGSTSVWSVIMLTRTGRALATVLAAGLVSCLQTAALAAPVGALKQFKVPTANSQPRVIANGSDGNRWFTEGTEFTGSPAKIAKITPAGVITEFAPGVADGCNFCIITDIAQGPGDILYITSNDATLMRFNVAAQSFQTPVQMPTTSTLGGNIAISADDVWITDFNNDSLWRYNITSGQFTQFPVPEPADVAVDSLGRVWFTAPLDGAVNQLDPATGTVTSTGAAGLVPRALAVAADGQVWFTARFTPQGVGRLNPNTDPHVVTTIPLTNVGPEGIAASPDGSLWFTQTTKGNVASINNAGVITEAKTVKGSEPFGITVAPNGDPWYTMMSANKIATLQLR